MRTIKTVLMIVQTISDIGKANQIALNASIFAKKYAIGSNSTSCLNILFHREYIPCRNAWKVLEHMMLYPARIKWNEMIFMAGIPMASIVLDALKMLRS